jgi:aminopeptidase N
VAFHAEDGEGYAFLAKRIAIIDSFNSGVAANLARAFAKYPSLEGAMADKMEVQLKQLLCRPGLSRDVYEIVSNTLSSRASKA